MEWALLVGWNGRWWLFGIDVGGFLELSLMVINGRCWLFGMNVGGCLELSLVVVWN